MDTFLLIHYFDITSMINLVGDIKEKAPFLAKNYVNKFVWVLVQTLEKI